MADADIIEASRRIIRTVIDEFCAPSAFAECIRNFSTARLQEMRRAVDAELAARMAPREDLRDERAGRT